MSQKTTKPKPKKIDKHDFYFESSLYTTIKIVDIKEDLFKGYVDAYSAKNHSETTYEIEHVSIDTWWHAQSGKRIGYYWITLTCKRKDNDVLRYVVYRDEEKIIKVGQSPSLADLQFSEIGKKYSKVLPEEDLKNLKKAIGLVSHGAGAGSFVYLRRIFENLIYETYTNNQKSLTISVSDFRNEKMLKKIEILKDFLPSQLVEMKKVYTILGKGVHELTEEQCLQYFRPIKLSIELILDQKIEEEKKKERDEKVKKELQVIHQEINK